MMKIQHPLNKLLLVATTLFFNSAINAQRVGIGTSTPLSTSILDVSSTSLGSLPFPRMDSSQRKAITTPARGLMVYQTDGELLYMHDGTNWGYMAANKQQTLVIASNATSLNCTKGLNANITLTGDITITIQNAIPGFVGFISVKQDGTGNRKLLIGDSNSKVSKNGAGLLGLSTAPNAVDLVKFYFDGSFYYWEISHNYN